MLTRHHNELGLLRFHLHERQLVVILQRILRLVHDLQDGVRHRVRPQIRLVERALDDHAILVADQHSDHRLVRGLDSLQYLIDFVLAECERAVELSTTLAHQEWLQFYLRSSSVASKVSRSIELRMNSSNKILAIEAKNSPLNHSNRGGLNGNQFLNFKATRKHNIVLVERLCVLLNRL